MRVKPQVFGASFLSMRDFKTIQCSAEKLKVFNSDLDNYESEMFSILMHSTGVYSFCSNNDLFLLAKRIYILYGNYISTELLLLEAVFFRFFEGEIPDQNMDIGEFMMQAYETGVCRKLLTSDLPKILNFSLINFENLSDDEFFSYKIPTCSNHWVMDRGVFLFPGTNRNYKLRYRLKNGGFLKNKEVQNAEKWADMVVRYL